MTDAIKLPILKTPYCVHASGPYLLHMLSYSRLCVKNRKFSFPWQQGSVWVKCDWHGLIGWPQEPYHGTKSYESILYTTGVMANLLSKVQNFHYHGNRGRLRKVWLTPLNWPNLKTPYCVQVSWTYIPHTLSYSWFGVENRKFSLPWQQGSVWAECDWHSLIGRARQPRHRTKNYDYHRLTR